MGRILHAAAVQMRTTADKEENVRAAAEYVKKLAGKKRDGEEKPDLVILPEMFCCPYQTELFPVYAEEEGGPTWEAMSALARECGIYLIAGSMPERDGEGRIYNTSYIFNRQGEQIGKHRKVHLFDIAVEGGQCFRESATLTAGDALTVFDTEFGRLGVMICFDIRFPEWTRLMADAGAGAVFVPAAFNMTTGPAHWELSFRARALDNQIWMMGCAPARDEMAGYISWGHSICTDPWGRVAGMLDEKEGVLTAALDLDYDDSIRRQLPLLSGRRRDLYRIIYS